MQWVIGSGVVVALAFLYWCIIRINHSETTTKMVSDYKKGKGERRDEKI
jgi:hypothetical protein